VLKRLNTLSCELNDLETIPAKLFRIRTLTYLDLSKNKIYDIPNGLSGLVALKTLILESNYIATIPGEIARIKTLKVIILILILILILMSKLMSKGIEYCNESNH
jgi:Leucine-rich repeat (LRR) protein